MNEQIQHLVTLLAEQKVETKNLKKKIDRLKAKYNRVKDSVSKNSANKIDV